MVTIPSRRALLAAEAENERLGHENFGFLSAAHGFMPRQRPLQQLPASHWLWDEVAGQLPELFRSLTLRATLEEMAILSAAAADLPDRYLLRASAIFGIFAHAYHYVRPDPYEALPASVQLPWREISRRLQQPAPHLSFIDLNLYNWQLIDPDCPEPLRMENMKLLIPILGNEDERRFQMTPTELVARFTPLLTAVIEAQEAVQADRPAALKVQLALLAAGLQELAYDTFAKVNPNQHSPLYVNPVVWGKTVAPLATPFQSEGNIPGPSGTAIPTFQLLDILFGRRAHTSSIGRETVHARHWFPPHWRTFLDAAEKISVADYVANSSDRALKGIFKTAVDAYAGEAGLLGRHRLKTYGFLDLSFKAGRSKTLGGFGGSFDDRMWDKMDGELELARLERYTRYAQEGHLVPVRSVRDVRREGDHWVKEITFDVRGVGLHCQAGDRCAILPENDPALVEKTLTVLGAHGDEPIPLNQLWREAVKLRDGYEQARVLSLRSLLTFGRIRPVARETAKWLHALTHNERLWQIIEARAEDQWELWDLLAMLAECGLEPRRLWKAAPGEQERICRLVPPESFRTYSVAAVERAATGELTAVQLMVGRLHYETPGTAVSPPARRQGVGSGFLARLAEPQATNGRRIAIRLVHPPRFSLPGDSSRPIVMFAGGTGLAPFRSLIQARLAQEGRGENWLFFGTRTPADLYYEAEWAPLVEQGRLQLRAAFSQADLSLEWKEGQRHLAPGRRGYINAEMVREENGRRLYRLLQSRPDGGLGATFFVCGHTEFARTVMAAIKRILIDYGDGAGDEAARQTRAQAQLYRLIGENRYRQEIFTTYAGVQFEGKRTIPASEVVDHNNDEAGYWMIIDGRVYDLSEFAHLHPGGFKIIRSYAGMDATAAYQAVLHHINSEVDAMLGMYEIGVARRLNFGRAWGVTLSPKGLTFVTLRDLYRSWIQLLYQVIEMENALHNDFSVRDEPMTYDEAATGVAPSPYRRQHYLQSYNRFRHDYQAKIVNDLLPDLWLLTSSLCDEGSAAGWLAAAFAEVAGSTAARATAEWETTLAAHLRDRSERTTMDEQEQSALLLERAAKRYLDETKQALKRGLQLFEKYERHTLTQGRTELLDLLRQMPKILADYYQYIQEQLI